MRKVVTSIAPLACLLVATLNLQAANPPTLAIGSVAPDFSLPGIDDKQYSLADFADAQLLAIVFTCNHCPTAQAYEERLKALVEKYQARGVRFVAISPNDDKAVRLDELGYTDLGDSLEDMQQRAKDHEFNFTYLYDGETQEMSQAYGPVATPHVFLFDKQRKLRFAGRIDNAENPTKVTTHDTQDAIEALLAGRSVAVPTTRTFGCSIKWSDKRESAVAALKKWDEETAELSDIDTAGVRELVKNDTPNLRVINIWSTRCGPCITEFPELVKMHRMYRNREFELVTITTDPPERREAALNFLNKQHASMKNYLFSEDDPDKLADALGVEWPGAQPFTLVVKPGGEVVFTEMGPIEPLEVRRAVVEQLSRFFFKPAS